MILSDYSAVNGDALLISAPTGTTINDDQTTERLIDAGILVYSSPSGESALTALVGSGNEFPFMVACDAPLYGTDLENV